MGDSVKKGKFYSKKQVRDFMASAGSMESLLDIDKRWRAAGMEGTVKDMEGDPQPQVFDKVISETRTKGKFGPFNRGTETRHADLSGFINLESEQGKKLKLDIESLLPAMARRKKEAFLSRAMPGIVKQTR